MVLAIFRLDKSQLRSNPPCLKPAIQIKTTWGQGWFCSTHVSEEIRMEPP